MRTILKDTLTTGAILATLALPAGFAVAHPTSWSPLGQNSGQQAKQPVDAPQINLDDFDIPEGWEPGTGTVVVIPALPTKEV